MEPICPQSYTFNFLVLSYFLVLEVTFNQQTIDFIRYLSRVELEPVSTQLKLGISEMNVDTELIYSEAKLGYSLGHQY